MVNWVKLGRTDHTALSQYIISPLSAPPATLENEQEEEQEEQEEQGEEQKEKEDGGGERQRRAPTMSESGEDPSTPQVGKEGKPRAQS